MKTREEIEKRLEEIRDELRKLNDERRYLESDAAACQAKVIVGSTLVHRKSNTYAKILSVEDSQFGRCFPYKGIMVKLDEDGRCYVATNETLLIDKNDMSQYDFIPEEIFSRVFKAAMENISKEVASPGQAASASPKLTTIAFLARDQDGGLHLFFEKPHRIEVEGVWEAPHAYGKVRMEEDSAPDLKFEDSPIMVEYDFKNKRILCFITKQ